MTAFSRQNFTAALALGIMILVGSPASANGGGDSATLMITVNAQFNCQISVEPIDGLTFTSGQADALDFSGQVDLNQCFGNFRLSVSDGMNNNGIQRKLRNTVVSNQFLNYQLFRDSARANVWSEAEVNHIVVTNNEALFIPFYGQIPGGQIITADGDYSDTMEISIIF